MKKIIVSQFLTLDGVMDSPEKWNSKYSGDAEVVNEILADFLASDLLLFGKTTYDFFLFVGHQEPAQWLITSTTFQSLLLPQRYKKQNGITLQ